jgi:alkylation response protein AidB-like acyl-CoA dehydrogenase
MMTDSNDSNDLIGELKSWLDQNWNPDMTVGEWWERLGLAGWAAPTLPEDAYGKGVSRSDAVRIAKTIAEYGALGAPGGLGLLLAAPTIAKHGTREQIDFYVKGIVTGKHAWCQLFSEPGAGSDLAGLTTKAEKDGDKWIINGQKVWTSGGQIADYGMLLARTNWDVPKHQGISYFALNMHQPGVEVRPLREMTGRTLFNEVFITDAEADDFSLIGGLNNGWAVANSTLSFEREGLGAGGGGEGNPGLAIPGQVVGHLNKRAGDFVRKVRQEDTQVGGATFSAGFHLLKDLAKGNGKISDPNIRQALMKLYILTEIARFSGLRQKALRSVGGAIAGLPNIAKLSMSDIVRLTRDLGLQILGMQGTCHAYDDKERENLINALKNPFLPIVTESALFAQAPPIYGGTDQIQKNILGERVLGLPREPSVDREVPFKDLPRNA